MSDIYFTADTHFGHARVIGYRGFSSVEDMDEHLIEQWNRRIKSTDRVYHLGDFCFYKADKTLELMSRLNGQINLVRGNHDNFNARVKNRFQSVKDLHEIKIGNRKVVLCHFPLVTWNRASHGSWHLHGHSHGSLDPVACRLDVGVDTSFNFSPIHQDEIVEDLGGEVYEPVDHHGRPHSKGKL